MNAIRLRAITKGAETLFFMSLLHDLDDNRNNRNWIVRQLDNLREVIQWGLRHGGTSDQALMALLYLYPYVIMTGKLDAWSGVLYDALLLAQDTQIGRAHV